MVNLNDAARFQQLFTGFSKAHGTYQARELTGNGKQKPKHRAVKAPCTSQHYISHLNGERPLGVYVLDDDEMVQFAAIDIDEYPIDLCALSKKLNEWKLPVVVCNSKSGGAHLYTFFSRQEQPEEVRNVLAKVSKALKYPKAEIFPKQISRQNAPVGNFINLPFFAHPKLSYSCWNGDAHFGLSEFLTLAEARQTSVDAFEKALESSGLLIEKITGTPSKKVPVAGRNEFLFNFGSKVYSLFGDMTKVAQEVRNKNQTATGSDHPNFDVEGPLPCDEVKRLIKSIENHTSGASHQIFAEAIDELNKKHAHVMTAGKAKILTIRPDSKHNWHVFDFSSPADFRSCYGNRFFKVGGKRMSLGAAWLMNAQRRSYDGVTFYPGQTDPAYFNLFQGFPVTPVRGDCSLYLSHIKHNICKCDEDLFHYILDWMADAVQNPAHRPGVALVIKGRQGVGKGVFVNIFARLFGPHYIQVSQSAHLVGNFNAHLRDKLLVFADEAFWAGDKRAEGALKALITEDSLAIELKGVDVQSSPNFARLILASNNNWVVPATFEQRRFVVIEAGEARMQDSCYFKNIVEQMEKGGLQALMQPLMERDLKDANLRKIPRTQALIEQQLYSLDSVGQWLYHCLDIGGFEEPISGGLIELLSWPKQYTISNAHFAYLSFCKRNSISHPLKSSVFGKKLNEFLPSVQKYRITVDKKRKNFYELPSLVEARQEFTKITGLHSVQWAEEKNPIAET